jgi:hypothetical protein
MILPYCISYFSDIYKEKWSCASLDDFWSSASHRYGNCTEKNDTENLKGTLVSQGKETIINTIDFSFYSISSFLNFSFSLMVISVVLDFRFFICILISSIFIAYFKNFISPKMEKLSENRNNNGSAVSKTLTSIHDNYHHGSTVNRIAFKKVIRANVDKYLDSRVREANTKYAAMLVTSLFSLIPTTCLVLYLLLSPEIDTAIKLGIVVNLTRIYHILVSANELVSTLILLPSVKGQINILTKFSIIKPLFNTNSNSIVIQDNFNNSIIEPNELNTYKHGWLSIIGRNGSGKTSFLKTFQKDVGGLYFNPSYRVHWDWDLGLERDILSDGEYTEKSLKWLFSNTNQTLLLDEWDAFLDSENTKNMEKLISSESEKRLILQVRQ